MIDDELSPDARALLDAARPALGPDPAAIARMHRNIAATVGAATVGTSAVASASAKSSITATGSSLALKLGALALVGVLAVGAALLASGERATGGAASSSPPRAFQIAPHAPAVEPSSEPVTPSAPRREAVAEVAPAPAPTPTPALAGPEPVEIERVAPRRRTPARASLAREVELIDQAMVALRNGNAADALAAIQAHTHETRGAGQLAEDAAAIEIEALCRLEHPEIEAKLAAFDARFPRSAQRTRLTEACR